MVRLVVDHRTLEVSLQSSSSATGKSRAHGRSAYICNSKRCLEAVLKGTRLKAALEGRKVKGAPNRRSIRWPLEPQLIQDLSRTCTDACQTCKNTQEKEDGE